MQHDQNVLIYRLGSLGDTIVALPCFHIIRKHYPDANITLLTNQPVANKAAPIEAVLGNDYFFNRVLAYPIGTRNPFVLLSLIQQIRSLNIHAVINLTAARSAFSVKRDRWFFKVAGVKQFVGFPSQKRDLQLVHDPLTGDFEWEAQRLARRVLSLGTVSLEDGHNWDLRLTETERNEAHSQLKEVEVNAAIIAVSAGTKMQAKDWGEVNWTTLIEQLGNSLSGWTLVMIGAPDEYDLSERCINRWKGKSFNLCGKTSPRVSAAILKEARVFVGHDSGPMHLAACVGTPCVAVFSARNLPRQWYPRGDKNKILYHRTDCAGCGLETCIEQRKRCILSITVDEVEKAILSTVNDN